MKKWILKIIGILLFVYLLSSINYREFLQTLSRFRWYEIVFIEVLSLLIIILKAFRFHSLLIIYKIQLPFKKILGIYGSSMYLSTVTPGRIGDFAKIFYLKNLTNCTFKKGLFLSIIDRIFDLGILGITAIMGLYFITSFNSFYKIIILTIIIIGISSFFIKDIVQWTVLKINKIICSMNKSQYQIDNVNFNNVFNWKLIIPAILSILPYLIIFYQMIYIAQHLEIDINNYILIGTLALGNLISMIPISISGLGTRDTTFSFILSKFGLTAVQAITLSFTFFLLNNMGILFFGFILFLITKPSLKND